MDQIYNLPPGTLWICTDQITKSGTAGRAYCKLFEQNICFYDLAELILLADEKFDETGWPQAYQQRRSFYRKRRPDVVRNPRFYLTDQELTGQKGKVSTTCVVVESRRHSGWQGVYIDSRGKPTRFLSEMELLRKMDSDIFI